MPEILLLIRTANLASPSGKEIGHVSELFIFTIRDLVDFADCTWYDVDV
jgi:hypothetical protein